MAAFLNGYRLQHTNYGDQRRQIYNDKVEHYDVSSFAEMSERFVNNARGQVLFTQSFKPLPSSQYYDKPLAVVYFAHGYVDMTSWMFKKYVVHRYIEKGYHVYTGDHMGHGRSDGLYGYIPNYNDIVDDNIQNIKYVRSLYDKSIKLFATCESMGGAILISIAIQHPDLVDGIVLQAPMATISQSIRPPPAVVSALTGIASYIPTAPITPGADMDIYVWKRADRLAEARAFPLKYGRKARLATAVQLLAWTEYNEKNFSKVTTPFFVLHGSADKVTDPEGSKKLHQHASSKDKTIKLYDGCYHCMLTGEEDAKAASIFEDMHQWMKKRA